MSIFWEFYILLFKSLIPLSFWFCDLGPFKYKAEEISSMDLDKEEEDVQEDEDEAEVGTKPKSMFMCWVFLHHLQNFHPPLGKQQ